jgi:hypothetical protein
MAVQNTPTWQPHVPNVRSAGNRPSSCDVMPGSARHLALGTFPNLTHVKDRLTARTFHVACIPCTPYCHYMVTESRGLLITLRTPDAGFAGLHPLPAALTVQNVPVE